MTDSALAVANLLERIGHLARNEEQLGDLYPAQWAALRYLARANRFSRNPMALTRYLGTTRGTVSQTIIALERKGYVRRMPSERDKRSVDIELTPDGRGKLDDDPIRHFAEEIDDALGADTSLLRQQLERLLKRLIDINDGRSFGQCRTCRHFRKDVGDTTSTPHFCALLEAGLSEQDGEAICVEQETA